MALAVRDRETGRPGGRSRDEVWASHGDAFKSHFQLLGQRGATRAGQAWRGPRRWGQGDVGFMTHMVGQVQAREPDPPCKTQHRDTRGLWLQSHRAGRKEGGSSLGLPPLYLKARAASLTTAEPITEANGDDDKSEARSKAAATS